MAIYLEHDTDLWIKVETAIQGAAPLIHMLHPDDKAYYVPLVNLLLAHGLDVYVGGAALKNFIELGQLVYNSIIDILAVGPEEKRVVLARNLNDIDAGNISWETLAIIADSGMRVPDNLAVRRENTSNIFSIWTDEKYALIPTGESYETGSYNVSVPHDKDKSPTLINLTLRSAQKFLGETKAPSHAVAQ